MKYLINKIKEWWHGEDVFYENKPSDPFFIVGWDNKKHWTSKAANGLWNFIIKNKKLFREIFVGVIVGIILFYLTKLFTND